MEAIYFVWLIAHESVKCKLFIIMKKNENCSWKFNEKINN